MLIRKTIVRSMLIGAFAMFAVAACGEESAFSKETLSAANKLAKSKKETPRTPFGQDAADYVLTFADEFDSFNSKIWNDHVWYEKSNPTRNYTVENGMLKIWPQRDASGKFFNRTIDTDGKFEQRFGFFEIEAKLPRGKGTWPAFWLFAHPDKRRPEIDVMEAYAGGEDPWGYVDADGVARPTSYGATVWFDEGVEAGKYQHQVGKDLSSKFHKYAVKWEPDRQTFYFDGKKVHTVEANMTDRMYIMLDLWFGSSSGDPDESTPQGKSNSFEINYVRVWQLNRYNQ
jgi:beta-glucanase (GH16 family)